MNLWPPMRFRFTAEADVAEYGDGWWTWDEVALAGRPARELIAFEEVVDVEFPRLVRRLHDGGDTVAHLAAMWIAVRLAGREVAWNDFNPAVWLTKWEPVPLGRAEAPDSGEPPKPDSTSSEPPSEESATS